MKFGVSFIQKDGLWAENKYFRPRSIPRRIISAPKGPLEASSSPEAFVGGFWEPRSTSWEVLGVAKHSWGGSGDREALHRRI